jgi:hypothetical protein
MSGGADMFKKKLDFSKDSVVPQSSFVTFAACCSFAVYGIVACEKPNKHSGTSTVSAVDATKFKAIDSKIGDVEGALKAAKAEIADLKHQLVGI